MTQIDRPVDLHRLAKRILLSFVLSSTNTRPLADAKVGTFISAEKLAFASLRVINIMR